MLTRLPDCFKVVLMSDRSEFYQEHLDRVSRSFAFCIRQLPAPLRDWVSLSYLLCRTLDTIEDAAWESPAAQMRAFAAFDEALSRRESAIEFKSYASQFPRGIPTGERALIEDADQLFVDFHQLTGSVRDNMRELIGVMSKGMQHFCRQKAGGALHLRTLNEVNQYCFFVAGVVGELLAKLVAKVEPKFSLNPLNLLRAHHFGLFLQKVNLLKDQVGDEKAGRHLIPSRELVEASSAENARWALDFLLDIPSEQIEFRRFCAWSLFLGLEALNVARRSIGEQRVLKIARRRTDEILEQVEDNLQDNNGLKQLFVSFKDNLGWAANHAAFAGDVPRSLNQLGVTL